MTEAERRRRVEDVCDAALQRAEGDRAGFVAIACGDDETVRQQVEALLFHAEHAEAFLATPIAAVAALVLTDEYTSLEGRRVGVYQILSLIGEGGMGRVYRARDTKLDRDVAIKILSEAFAVDGNRVARFQREAKILAALNHPNIAQVFGLEQEGDVHALAMELVPGEDLSERIARGPIPMDEALLIAKQIAEALEAAHEQGIIHRDLKPANIKVRPDGTVKVLDFGLAKLAQVLGSGLHASDATQSPMITSTAMKSAGMILGTAAYMSPEQASGRAVDKRTDIWAFGCVLYEMLTGGRMFKGADVAEVLAAVVMREPDMTAAPMKVRRLLAKCVAKDPQKRLRDLGDAWELLEGGATAVLDAAKPAPNRRGIRIGVGIIGLGILGAAAILLTRGAGPPPVENPLANARFSRLTDWPGAELAVISPDGRFVAFVADRDGEFDLFLKQVGTGSSTNLTKDIPPVSGTAILRTVGFSGDGGEVWFTEGRDPSAPKWLIPLTGGTPRALLGQGAAAPAWSPDDTRLVYFITGSGDPFYLADRTGADARPLVVRTDSFFTNAMHNHNPVWSSDGQWIYFVHGAQPEELNVWRVRPSGDALEQLTSVHAQVNYVAPIDRRTLLYTARSEDGSGPWLWSLDVDSKVTRRVTSGLEHYSSVSASRDGRRVVATVENPTANLWSVPLLNRQAEDGDVHPFPLKAARAFAPRFRKGSLFYLSASGGGDGLWVARGGQESQIWTSAGESLTEPPAVSPDGSHVAIVVRQDGKQRLLVMADDGTNARTLAPSIEIRGSGGHGSADWSPDGTWIVAAGSDAQGPGLFKIPIDGGAPVRLVSDQVVNPVCSPDGTLIVYGGPVVDGQVPLLGVRPDGTSVALPNVFARLGGGHRFLPNGTLVYLPRSQSRDFWLLDLATKATRPLTHLGDQSALNAFDITADGKQIVFDRLRVNSDIYLIEIPRPE